MQRQNPTKKVSILSIDYDGCGDILFYNIDNSDYFGTQEHKDNAKQTKKIFSEHLKSITANADIVEVYVGSNRQDRSDDSSLSIFNENGSCFDNFAQLCDSMGWQYRRLLMADIHNNKPSGTAMDNPELASNFLPRDTKKDILYHQLSDARQNHPDADIDFHFFDDKAEPILKNCFNHFHENQNLFANINLIFTHYDWFAHVFEDAPHLALQEYGTINFKPSTPGIPDLVVAGVGAAATLAGIGLFAYLFCKSQGENQSISLESKYSPF